MGSTRPAGNEISPAAVRPAATPHPAADRVAAAPPTDAVSARTRASLETLIHLIERVAPGMRGSVLLLDDDGVTLRHGAAPSLPPEYTSLIDGEKIGPNAGSCGTAAFRGEQVIVRDIATDPLWSEYKRAALPFGLAACWSTPIIDPDGRVLGTFAMYYGEPREPTPSELTLTRMAADLAFSIVSEARAVTALRAGESLLRSSQERLRAALDASETCTWRWDMHTGMVDGDDGLFRLFGVDPVAAAGSFDAFVARIHPEDRDRVIAAAMRCAAEGVDLDEEFRIVRPDGSMRWAVDKGKIVRGADGAPAYLIGACVDVTERRVRDEQFRALAESIPQLAWMADVSGSRDWFNRRWYEYTGLTAEQARGWGWRTTYHPDHVERVIGGIRRAWASGRPWEETLPMRRSDGEYRWFLARAQPIRDAEGRVVRWFGTSTDINELREAELARDRALEEAQRASRAKSQFLAGMSHDLRTPLGAIGGFAELTADGIYGPVTDEQRQAMTRIRSAGDHLLALINDILTFAKIEAGRIEVETARVAVGEVVMTAAGMIEIQAAKKGLLLEREPSPDGADVMADRERMTQILINLLTNAVKFSETGAITIATRVDPAAVHVDVRDTGRGIPADRLAAIFEPFVQAGRSREERQQGVGLGLAISRELARAMRGELVVASTPGAGSTFTLSLPRAAPAA